MPPPSQSPARRVARFAVLPAALAIAFLCAILSIAKISLLPPGLEHRDFQRAGVVTHMLVDTNPSAIADRGTDRTYFNRINARADAVAHLMATPSVLRYIGRRAHVPPEQIAADALVTLEVAGPLT